MPAAIITSFLLIAVGWLLMMNFFAWSSGWQRLASEFPALEAPRGQRLRGRWLKVGWVDYNGCVNYWVDAEGLRIKLWPIVNIGHAPLAIPWSAMHVESVKKEFLRRGQVVCLAIGEPLIVKIAIPEAVFEAGKAALAATAALDEIKDAPAA